MRNNYILLLCALLAVACSSKQSKEHKSTPHNIPKTVVNTDTVSAPSAPKAKPEISDTAFVKMKAISTEFKYEMRYATSNNFMHQKVYDCDQCLVRYEVAKALINANDSLQQLGYRIKFFDCFRPVEVQKKMWDIFPQRGYVANPYQGGSIHNRGAAVDITLVKINGDTVNMGTDFDHFGPEAHHSYTNLPAQVLQNRKLLKSTMEHFGFKGIRTEWWHYNFAQKKKYAISDQPLCE